MDEKNNKTEVGKTEETVEKKPETKPLPIATEPESKPEKKEEPTEEIKEKPEVTKKSEDVSGKEYIIPLRKGFNKVPRYKRANKAVKGVKEFLVRHMKVYDRDLNKIKVDKYLNEFLWFRGIKRPPAKVKIKVFKDGENFRVELADMPNKIKFKKERLEKREREAAEFMDKKKASQRTLTQKAKDSLGNKIEKAPEKSEEEKKEEKEKAKAGEEAMQKMEKAAAKTTKHMVGGKTKEPKRQVRKALAK